MISAPHEEADIQIAQHAISLSLLRRRYTMRFARTEPADCPVHGPIEACDRIGGRIGGKIGIGGSVLIWKRDIVDKERITTD